MLNGSVKDKAKSTFIMVENQPTIAYFKAVMWTGQTTIGLFDGVSSDSYLGIVIEVDKIRHSIAYEGITPVDLPDGEYYSDALGNVGLTGLFKVGNVIDGWFKFVRNNSSGNADADAYNNGGCCGC